ncbi:MAG: Trm112 family protein [Hyphomicrobium sp.]
MSGAAAVDKVDAKLLEILVCPLTKTMLEYDAAACELISRAGGVAFPIIEGVPYMRLEDARRLDEEPRRPPR